MNRWTTWATSLLALLLLAASLHAAGPDSTKKKKGFLGRVFAPTEQKAGAKTDSKKKSLGARLKRLFTKKDNQPAEKGQQELNTYEREYETSIQRKDYQRALRYLQLYEATRDSLLEVQLDYEQAVAETERQRTVTWSVTGGLVLVLGFAGVLLWLFREKRKANVLLGQINVSLQEANEEILTQQEVLSRQHRDIVSSIEYARRIQEAILPAQQQIAQVLPQSFVLYRPKDIVSGDFFWFHQTPMHTLFAAVDCTGHGVPGAFMSVLGMSLLNQILASEPGLAPGDILNRLHQGVIASLKQQQGRTAAQDGMDLTLCALRHDRREVLFAGANNPLYVLRKDGPLEEVKGEKAPIGGARYASHTFTTQRLALEAGDALYLFSDGLADQFGGPQGRKFTYRRLRELLVETRSLPMPAQQQQLEAAFERWRGQQEQVDDVLVLGVRV